MADSSTANPAMMSSEAQLNIIEKKTVSYMMYHCVENLTDNAIAKDGDE